MSFSERNVAPRAPAGPAIPEGVRTSILSWFERRGITPTSLWRTYREREGYGRWGEVTADIANRFGREEGLAFASAMERHFAEDEDRGFSEPGVDYDAEPALLALPALLFLDVVELALDAMGYAPQRWETVQEINRLFARRGVSYEIDANGDAQWHGDPGLYASVLRPALDALADPRMAGSAAEFHAARGHLRAGSAKDREDAVEEAAKSVESAMKAVLDARQIPLSGKESAEKLWQLLRDAGVLETPTHHAVVAVASLRNEWGGHGQGPTVRSIPTGVPELALTVSASAIAYLSALLP